MKLVNKLNFTVNPVTEMIDNSAAKSKCTAVKTN